MCHRGRWRRRRQLKFGSCSQPLQRAFQRDGYEQVARTRVNTSVERGRRRRVRDRPRHGVCTAMATKEIMPDNQNIQISRCQGDHELGDPKDARLVEFSLDEIRFVCTEILKSDEHFVVTTTTSEGPGRNSMYRVESSLPVGGQYLICAEFICLVADSVECARSDAEFCIRRLIGRRALWGSVSVTVASALTPSVKPLSLPWPS